MGSSSTKSPDRCDYHDLRRGDLVEAVDVPRGITLPHPEPGERGVCFEEENAYGDGNGPMVRFVNGGVCNVYNGWVKIINLKKTAN